uniref:Solute carrier family 35 member A4 n=1 Tax=Chrysolophus pictus TaxID=9089 RepID=A0A8C3KU58_CHRPC
PRPDALCPAGRLAAGLPVPEGFPGRLPGGQAAFLGGAGLRRGDVHRHLRRAELRRARRGEDGAGLPQLAAERRGVAGLRGAERRLPGRSHAIPARCSALPCGSAAPCAASREADLPLRREERSRSLALHALLRQVDGAIPFSSSAVVVLIELTKLVLSLLFLLAWDRQLLGAAVSWRHVAPFALSALLYAANNNLVVHMQLFMDPSTYQILSNLKIVSTALLYSLLLRQRLRVRQWLALCLLMAAGAQALEWILSSFSCGVSHFCCFPHLLHTKAHICPLCQ